MPEEPLYAKTIAELEAMTDEDLVEAHDEQARGTVVGVKYYLAELQRRRNDRHSRQMLQLTWVVTVLTVVNVVAVVFTLLD